jgi:hypothetical protein
MECQSGHPSCHSRSVWTRTRAVRAHRRPSVQVARSASATAHARFAIMSRPHDLAPFYSLDRHDVPDTVCTVSGAAQRTDLTGNRVRSRRAIPKLPRSGKCSRTRARGVSDGPRAAIRARSPSARALSRFCKSRKTSSIDLLASSRACTTEEGGAPRIGIFR